MNNDIEEIKSKLNIVDILGEYIRLDKAGANWRALCPFHNEKSPSFMVNEEKQFWHCFGCQKSGDIFAFVMEMEGVEFREALNSLAEKAGVKLQSYSPEKSQEKNRTLEILELATKFYEVQLWKGEGKEKIINYLHERGLKDETIKEFRLGYVPSGWRNVLDFLVKRGYKIEEINKTGLLVQKNNAQPSDLTPSPSPYQGEGGNRFYDRFRDRIIFPISDYSGKVLGYTARVTPGSDESQAKYVNSPETEMYHKSRILYGLDRAKSEIKKQDFVLLVEGQMDVIASHQAGIKNTVAVSGTALTLEQIAIIKRYTKNIQMFFDMDSAGENATKKSVKLCLASGMAVRIVSLERGKDAADMAKENPEELAKSVAQSLPAVEYFFQKTFGKFDRNKVEDKKKITSELLDIILDLENEVEKNYWIKKLAEGLGVSESALTDELKKTSLKDKNTKDSGQKEDIKKIGPTTKKEMLIWEMIGLMLVSSFVWKKACEEEKTRKIFLSDNLLQLMLEKGEQVNFNFDTFLNEIVDDRELSEKARKLFIQKKYQLDLNNNQEEIIIEDPWKEFQACEREMEREEKKEELNRIGNDLKLAEERKDETAKKFLREQSDKISKELAKLMEL
ncbi:MAG: primase protein [Candidatus Moranbacteria bacterium GW2011_GWF2_36_839]|nr:MAG: primase protein [Candidatus Moranbacteria bacterium GW2011_GWF1_36_78]KKQ17444.1 MAG: primase protein [Candidatus Moranbacteria bacterium GW2011_GWF2_36_839]HAT73911.1 DNA primase [Candidatus Moranbacteria bacterium]HBY10563.1 DNA primase [Candidatus Moranbacteria bacterium]